MSFLQVYEAVPWSRPGCLNSSDNEMKCIFHCYRNAAQQTQTDISSGAHAENAFVTDAPAPQSLPSFYFKQLALWLGPSPGCLHLWAAEGVPARLTAFLQAMAAQGLNPAAPCSQRPRSEAGPGPASSPLRAHTVRSPVQAILGMPRLEWFIYLSTPVSGSFQVPESWTQKNTTFLPLKMTGREPNIKPRDVFPINVRQRFIILLQK